MGSHLKAKVKTREQRMLNATDHCVGLPDVSGIFSSGRSLGQLLEGSRLGKILSSNKETAQNAALDRRNEEKKERERRKEERKRKEQREEREERKEREAREKKERKEKRYREEQEKRRSKKKKKKNVTGKKKKNEKKKKKKKKS